MVATIIFFFFVGFHVALSVTLPFVTSGQDAEPYNTFQVTRIPKTASTSFLSVLMRARKKINPNAKIWHTHLKRSVLEGMSMLKPIFRATMVRDPATRCLSGWYFMTMRDDFNKKNNIHNKLEHFKSCIDFQASYLAPKMPVNRQIDIYSNSSSLMSSEDQNDLSKKWAKKILSAYDFIGIQERFDESMVLLAYQLGVAINDVLYLRQKTSGEEYIGENKHRSGQLPFHPPLEDEPKIVQEAAALLRSASKVDVELLHLVNERLDEVMAKGKEQFKPALAELKKKRKVVEKLCHVNSTETCWYNDIGCGQDCMDQMLAQIS